jgi:glycerophosphoryl diester phosphodiesterase
MKRLLVFVLACWWGSGSALAGTPWVIATGSGPAWPANCPVSLAVAMERGADSVGIAVSLTSDDQVVVMADPVLTEFTDADRLFPERIGNDGALVAPDLNLAELRQLTAQAPSAAAAHGLTGCRIATLTEILDLINLLEIEQQRNIGIVIELRKLWLHRKAGKDLAGAVINLLATKRSSGDRASTARTYLAAHDADELRRIHDQRLTQDAPNIGIIQIIDRNDSTEAMHLERDSWLPYNYDWLFTNSGLRSLSDHVDVIGVTPALLSGAGQTRLPDFFGAARLLGITLIVYPVDPLLSDEQPPAEALPASLDQLLADGFDGLLTGQYETIAELLGGQRPQPQDDAPPASTVDQIIDKLEQTPVETSGSSDLLLFH